MPWSGPSLAPGVSTQSIENLRDALAHLHEASQLADVLEVLPERLEEPFPQLRRRRSACSDVLDELAELVFPEIDGVRDDEVGAADASRRAERTRGRARPPWR